MEANRLSASYRLGPTACAPNPKVIKSITKQIKENRIVSAHELRIARRMGLVNSPPVTRVGFNDGVIYPYDEPVAGPKAFAAPARVTEVALPAKKKKKMHALALLVDFSDNQGTRPTTEFRNYSSVSRTRIR